mmetsp:Transcript_5412/g.24092  ORF Transcript_5412/g.24092 Transcript_5412/m.24092 type:complete len:411 (-) Transcript_5412:211-1443(-)
MAASGDDDALRVVDVKHGKDRHEIAVDDGAVFTARHLMDKLLDLTGVLQKNQKLLAKGKVLVADLPLAAQVKPKGGRATIMLMASAGGGGGAPRAMTAGEAALAASRAAKAAKLAEARKDGLDAMVTSEDRARARRAKEAFAANEAARRAAWGKTGVVGLREAGLDGVPSDVWDLGSAVRVLDVHRNRIASLPAPRVAALVNVTKLRLSGNDVCSLDDFFHSLAALPALTTLALEDNAIAVFPTPTPGSFPRLEELTLDGNALTSLPDAFGDGASMQSLRRLGVSGNALRSLPPSLGSCPRLDAIDARRNAIDAIPESFAAASMLRSLLLDGNRVGVGGVPTSVLAGCAQLCELSLRDNAATMEELREVDGWDAYETRRKARAGKVLESRVMLGERAFDEGGDVERFRRH